MTPTQTPTTLENIFSIQEEHVRKHKDHESKFHDHDNKFEEHEDKFSQHALKLQIQEEQIKDLKENSVRLENVVMTESRDTRTTIMTSNQQLYDLINNLMGYKTSQTQIQTNVKMAKYESLAKIVGILGSSGGVVTAALYYIFG